MSQEEPKPEVDTEHVDRPTGNLFSKTLNKMRSLRRMAVDTARHKMFERHKITYLNQNQYKIVEDRIVLPSGKEVIELRLYQLIDAAVVTINADVTSELEGGIDFLREFRK